MKDWASSLFMCFDECYYEVIGETNMEMDELFYQEPYRIEFDAEVLSCISEGKEYTVVLDDTAFYPEGGGQPNDTGTLNGIQVSDVQRKNERIFHYVSQPIAEGTKVHGIIDWNVRFDHMQQHSGEHIISGLIHSHFGYENTGFHMGEVVQIDFNGTLEWEDLLKIETEANALIMKDQPIDIYFPSKEELDQLEYRSKKELEGKIRIVSIPGADVCACCGTHVKTAGEIGLIKILSLTKRKNGVRIEMLSGHRAFSYLQNIYNNNQKISARLSSKPLETAEALNKYMQEVIEKDHKYHEMLSKYFIMQASQYEEGKALIIVFEEGLDRTDMTAYADLLIEQRHAGITAVLNKEKNGYSYAILSHQIDLSSKVKELNQRLNGKGGGRSEVIQGSFQADANSIEQALQDILLK